MSSVDLESLLASWLRHLRARNLSENTLVTYGAGARNLLAYLAGLGITDQAAVDKAVLEDWVGQLLSEGKASTASNRYRGVQQWFKWMAEEGEIDADPMATMKPPHVPEIPVDTLTIAQRKALLKVCEGRDFLSRRDTAIVRVFDDTGLRLGEVSRLLTAHVDLDDRVAEVLRTGRRPGHAPFGSKTALALDRYLRVRARDRCADRPQLWLAEKGRGPLTSNGIAQVLRRRGVAAGIAGLHPHQIRHTSVDTWLAAGGSEGDAMRLFGWKSRQMLARYAAKRADDRAVEAHHRLAPGDQI
jgi:site-specific recombinase XerD